MSDVSVAPEAAASALEAHVGMKPGTLLPSLRRAVARQITHEKLVASVLQVASSYPIAHVPEPVEFDDAFIKALGDHEVSRRFARLVVQAAAIAIEKARGKRFEEFLLSIPPHARALARLERCKVLRGGAAMLGTELFGGVDIHAYIPPLTREDLSSAEKLLAERFCRTIFDQEDPQ